MLPQIQANAKVRCSMVNENKVLTVSYGTFSCTLEGYADSFGAMKAIAEYFRDLASDDRYFAANPPDLDAATISEIATHNSQQKLKTRTQGTDVVLSPAEPESSESKEKKPKTSTQEVPLTERVQRIRALVDQWTINEDENEQANIWSSNEVIHADPIENFFADPDLGPPGAKTKPERHQARPPTAVSASDQTRAWTQLGLRNPAQTNEAQVANQITTDLDCPHPEPRPLEIIFDEIAEDPHSEKENTNSGKTDAPVKIATQTHSERETAPEHPPAPALEKLPANNRSEQSDKKEQEFENVTQTAGSSMNAQQKTSAEPPSRAERKVSVKPVVKVVRKSVAAKKAPLSDGQKSQSGDPIPPAHRGENQSQSVENTAQGTEAASPLAAVQKPAQKDVHVISFEDTLTEMLSLNSASEERSEKIGHLSPSGIEEEQKSNAKQAAQARPRQQVLRQEQQDVSRLLQQTDQKMAQKGQTRRRNALAHLRAAVAANKGETPADPTTNDILKTSTSSKVTAETLSPNATPPDGSKDFSSPEPLQLAEDQRIDAPNSAGSDMSQNSATVTPIDFLTYAQRVEATTLEALMEAAASYLSLVLKRDRFARRNVFVRVREVSQAPFKRKTYIQTFNTLIVQGKIRDLEDGSYEIFTDKIGYQLPDQILH